jgi:branched-chain amino acid transport system permease protein
VSTVSVSTVSLNAVAAHLNRGARWRGIEILFWLAILGAIFGFPSRALLINEILLAGLFALSLDLVLGYAGIVSLGQAAFFGVGAYAAGIIANAGLADPLPGLIIASLVAGALGLVTAPLLLRGSDLTRLMVTLGIALLLGELANENSWATGGADGLSITLKPIVGLFRIDFMGQRNAALYSFIVLFLLFVLARRLVQSPFGLSVRALKENRLRSGALGISAASRLIMIYAIAAAYAGASGALVAQTTGLVSLDVFDFHRSADVMLMLIIGGAGYLYGGLIGAAFFIALKDGVSSATPEYWEFWIGLPLVILVLVGRERIGASIARFVRRTTSAIGGAKP